MQKDIYKILKSRKKDTTLKWKDGYKLWLILPSWWMWNYFAWWILSAIYEHWYRDCFDEIYWASAWAYMWYHFMQWDVSRKITCFYKIVNKLNFALKGFNPLRFFYWKKWIIDIDFIFESLISFMKTDAKEILEKHKNWLKFNVVATKWTTAEKVAIDNFETEEEILSAIRCSCSIPVMMSPAKPYKWEEYVDWWMIGALPWEEAVKAWCTHILVLFPWENKRQEMKPLKLHYFIWKTHKEWRKKFPKIYPYMLNFHKNYYKAQDDIPKYEKEDGKVFIEKIHKNCSHKAKNSFFLFWNSNIYDSIIDWYKTFSRKIWESEEIPEVLR